MNLSKLFEMQAALDTHIEHEHPRIENEKRLDKKILALLVELGELANEWRGFKYWSNNQKAGERLLEEYVDCLHFLLSIGNELSLIPTDIRKRICKTIVTQFNYVFHSIALLDSSIDNGYTEDEIEDNYEDVLSGLITLGEMLGFTWEQIETAYIKKNETNHQRQLSGY